MVLYEGPSVIDGKPIVVIGVAKSGNEKTGAMLQTFILRADIDPRSANQTGYDFSVCGNCKLAGEVRQSNYTEIIPMYNADRDKHYISIPTAKGRVCYVNLAQGVLNAWKKYRRGGHSVADPVEAGRGMMVRLGSYGDPAAVPADVWIRLTSESIGWTGYSHQSGFVDHMPELCMVSADTLPDAQAAWRKGERTFRVVSSVDDIQHNEVLCPASKEAGYKSTCAKCGLCNGTASKSPKSVAIVAHGSGKKHANNIIAAA